MKHKKRVWLSEEAYKSAKVASALEGMKLTAYLDKKLCSDNIKPSRDLLEDKKWGYHGFLK